MTVSPPRWVEIYRARNLPEAHAIRLALEEAGVRVGIDGELLQGVVGELPMGWHTAPRVLVEQSQVDAAREIIVRADAQGSAAPDDGEPEREMTCLACGRVMDGATVKCPSCGWSFQGQAEAEQRDAPAAVSLKPLSTKVQLQRISPASLAASCAVIGFVFEIPFAAAAVVWGARGWGGTIKGLLPFSGQGETLVLLGLVMPFLCAVAGALLGAAMACVLNLAARMGGGIEIEVQASSVRQPTEGLDRPSTSPN